MFNRTAPYTAADFDAIHESFDSPEAEDECTYCGAEDAPLNTATLDGEALCPSCLASLEAEWAEEAGAPLAVPVQSEEQRLTACAFADGYHGRPFVDPGTFGLRALCLDAWEAGADAREAEAQRAALRRAVAMKGRTCRGALDVPVGYPGESGAAPVLSRADAVEQDAADLFCHLSASSVRFDIRAKVAQAEAFTLRRGGASLAVPSKLYGTKGLQDRVELLASDVDAWDGGGSVYLPTVLHVLPVGAPNGPGVAVLAAPKGTRAGAYLVGYLQDKHARWIAPLLNATRAGTVTPEATPIRVYVTAVTGGTPEKPTRGVNVCITGVSEAVRGLWLETAREAREEAAYESGNIAKIEATMG